MRVRPSLRLCFFVSVTLLLLSLCVPQFFWKWWLVFVFNPEYFGSLLPVTFPSASYPLSSICCSYQKDERANPENLSKSSALSEVGVYLIEKYFHFLHIFFNHTSSAYPLLGLFCLFTRMDTYKLRRTFQDEGSTRPRDLYLTKHNTHKKQTSILQAGFESTIPAKERPQNYAVERTATGIFFPCWKR